MVKVLIVDDSPLVRLIIKDILEKAGIEVVGTAKNGKEAIDKVMKLNPDLVILDIRMPEMDGLTALKHIMQIKPIPVLMFSYYTKEGARETFEALKLGAIDFVPKPSNTLDLDAVANELINKINEIMRTPPNIIRLQRLKKFKGDVVKGCWYNCNVELCILIGSSTGGPSALEQIIPRLPADIPAPIFIVQHMPPKFTEQLAERLNSISEIEVKEAEDNEKVKKGVAYIAPGGKHMIVKKVLNVVRIKVFDGEPVNNVKPSVDVTAESVVKVYGGNVVGVILTGMGEDGARGMKMIREAGGKTIACSEDTCVIFGMPKAAIEMGGIDVVKPLYEIPEQIVKFVEVICGGCK